MQSITCHQRWIPSLEPIHFILVNYWSCCNFLQNLQCYFWFRIRISMPIYLKIMKTMFEYKMYNINVKKYYKNQTNNEKIDIFHKINVICGIRNYKEFLKILWPQCPHYFPHCIGYSLQFEPRRSSCQWSVVHVLTTYLFWCCHNITLKTT